MNRDSFARVRYNSDVPFSQILAQETSIGVLRRSMLDDQVGHAFLFYGPEGIGKRTTALAFAKALNCSDEIARREADYCDICRSCRMITLGQHPDVRLLTPETTGGKTVIPIDAIRTKTGENPTHPLPLREDAQLKPLEGRYKVYILDPANRPGFQEEAGNALLLTLEEPPPHVVMILISSRPSAVLPTLLSRSRPVRFQLASRDCIIHALAAVPPLSSAEATAIAGMACGRIGWALSVAANPQALQIRRALFTELDSSLEFGRPSALRLAEMFRRLASGTDVTRADEDENGQGRASADRQVRRYLPDLLDMTASWWRDLLVLAHGQTGLCVNIDYSEALARHTGRLNALQIQAGLHEIMQAKRFVERNANIDLALERLCMAILP